MSGTVTKTEFDDVLSSIRRLVSDKSSNETETVKKDNDRFVLTPALRVLDDLTPMSGEEDVLDTVSGSEAAADLDEPKAPQSPEFTAMSEAWTEELARVSADQNDPATQASGNTLPRPDISLELRIAELEEAVSQTADEWEPDGIEPEIASPPKHHIFEVVDNTKPQDAELADQDELDELDDLDHELEEISTDVVEGQLEDEPEEGKQVEDEQIEEEFVAENSENPDNVMPMFTRSTEGASEPYLLSQIIPNTGGDRASKTEDAAEFRHVSPADIEHPVSNSALVDNDDVFLDVEALRSMISDVVREELRGNMGESITRNLRRMVRQEIEVALLPKDGD